MDAVQKEKVAPEVERLLLDLARAWHWTGLYQPDHPFLAERMKTIHAALLKQVVQEPSDRLLLGIARDKVLYRDVFMGQGHHQIAGFAESLYLHQVATIGFDPEVAPEGLLKFFRFLQKSRPGKAEETAENFLNREGIRGIYLYPFNYKEVLSRRIEDEEGKESTEIRTESLWRLLLTANIGDKDGEMKVAEGLAETPELIPVIMKRARESEQKANASPGRSEPEEAVTPEVLRRMFQRLGDTIRGLSPDKKERILLQLESGIEGFGGGGTKGDGTGGDGTDEDGTEGDGHILGISLGRSLAGDYSEDEFLDILGSVMSLEKKGGKRLRKIFEVIASDRDVRGSLLPRLQGRVQESRRSKDYFAVKTWETVEKLLLSRSEEAYVGGEHSLFMEAISSGTAGKAEKSREKATSNPEILASFDEKVTRQKTVSVLLQLLAREKTESEFIGLLEDVQKTIPNLISRKEYDILETALTMLSTLTNTTTGECQSRVKQVIEEMDFAQVIDHYMQKDNPPENVQHILNLLTAFGALSVVPVLDRLLVEQEGGRRKILLALAVRLGEPAAPAILERISHPRWYFVRNVVYILGEIGYKGAVPDLVRALKGTETRVKREAIAALGKIKAPEAVSPLGNILLTEGFFPSAKDDPQRIEAANALFRIGGAEAINYLQRGTKVRRSPVRNHCATLLRTLEVP